MPTFATPTPISATIELALGDLRLRAGERETTVVDVRASDTTNDEDVKAAEATRIELTQDQLLVKAPKLNSWVSRTGGGSIDVTIDLPAGSHLHAALASADVQVDGRLGDCRIKAGLGRIRLDEADTLSLKSGAGDVSVNRATGRVEIVTGSGEVRLGELSSSAMIKNANGDTSVRVGGGDLRISAANGSITVDQARADVNAKSANGDVSLGEVRSGSVVAETQIGDLEVGISEGTAAWLDVSARAGTVHNLLDTADAPDPSSPTVEVRARTSIGAIVIRRAAHPSNPDLRRSS